jgi:DNA-binding MarR family transcriptional regulator
MFLVIQKALTEQSVTFTQLVALELIGDSPNGLRTSALATAFNFTLAGATGLSDRLLEKGLIIRTAGTDRRLILLNLTPAGRAALVAVESVLP